MRYLQDVEIIGDSVDVARVRDEFGEVYLGNPTSDPSRFVLLRFRNVYRLSDPSPPLFVLVPSEPIWDVWPGKVGKAEVKYGTSSKKGTQERVTSAVCIQNPDGDGLYICLDPKGIELKDEDNLGI